MAIFDPQEPFGTIHGAVQGCPGAKYSQGGAVFNGQKRCLREATGDLVALNSDISSPGIPKAVPAPPADGTEPVTAEPSKLEKKLKKALAAAMEANRQVPSTVNAEKVKSLQAQLDSQTTE